MKTFYALLLGLIFFSCGTQRVYLTITEPAPAYLSKKVDSIGIINRSFATGTTNKILDLIDKGLTAEGKIDEIGSKSLIDGAYNELSLNEQFKSIKILDSIAVESPGIGQFPPPLGWDEVERICKENSVNSLFVLEVYDTDTKITFSTQQSNQEGLLGVIKTIASTKATVTTFIKTGWRIYDPINKLIVDQAFYNRTHTIHGSGLNPFEAVRSISARQNAIMNISQNAGVFYAQRLLNSRLRVWRNYFIGGSPNLKVGKRKSNVGDWDGAANFWMKDTESAKRKVAGRAYYNMAIYNEINGDLAAAYDWAQQSYTNFNNKEAMSYARLLLKRKNRWEQTKTIEKLDDATKK